jgi:hypothetical protein
MMHTVITAPITRLGLGFWLAQPGSREEIEPGRYDEIADEGLRGGPVAEIELTQRSSGHQGG